MTALLEREMVGELLYQPEKVQLAVDDRVKCFDCDKSAVWEFIYHTDKITPCSRFMMCQAHTDRAIDLLVKIFDGQTSVECEQCGIVFRKLNDYIKVVRIP